jgi:hypothetical protein
MTNSLALFDDYNRQARLYPALLGVLPLLVALLAWYPSLLTTNIGTTLVTIAGSCGVLFGLSIFSRSCGKRAENRLLKAWGGWPTTLWLRHSGEHLPPPTKQRYHKALARSVPDIRLPSAAEETANPTLADESYRSAVEWLIPNRGTADSFAGSQSSIEVLVSKVPVTVVGATLLLLFALAGWMTLVSDAWVRQAGDQYARALLAVCDTL